MRVKRHKKPYRTILILTVLLTPASAISSDLFVRSTEALLTSSKQMTAVFQSADHFPMWYSQLVQQLASDAQQSETLTQQLTQQASSDKEDKKKQADREDILTKLNRLLFQETALMQNARATFEIISQAAATDELNYQTATSQKGSQQEIDSYSRVASWGQNALSEATSYLSRMQGNTQTCTSIISKFLKKDKNADQTDTSHSGIDSPQTSTSVVSDVYNKPSSN